MNFNFWMEDLSELHMFPLKVVPSNSRLYVFFVCRSILLVIHYSAFTSEWLTSKLITVFWILHVNFQCRCRYQFFSIFHLYWLLLLSCPIQFNSIQFNLIYLNKCTHSGFSSLSYQSRQVNSGWGLGLNHHRCVMY